MGKYLVELEDGQKFHVEADEPPTMEELQAFLAQPPVESEPEKPDIGLGRKILATGVEIGAPVVGGLVGTALAAPTGPGAIAGGAAGAAAFGAAGSALADVIRGEDVSGRRALANAAISAIPGGAAARLGRKTVASQVAAHAVEGGVLGAAQAEVGSLIERGEHATLGEMGRSAGFGATLGGLMGGVVQVRRQRKTRLSTGVETSVEATPEPEQLTLYDDKRNRLKPDFVQGELFDDTGVPRPVVAETAANLLTDSPTAATSQAIVNAVRQEGSAAARLLGSTEAARGQRRLYHRVAEAWERVMLTGDEAERAEKAMGLLDDMRELNVSMPELIRDYWAPAVRRSGRTLQQLSVLAKELKKLPGMEDALGELERAQSRANPAWELMQKVDDARRSMLVSQIATGVRNATTQAWAAAGNLLEAGITGGREEMRDQLASLIRAGTSRREVADGIERMLERAGRSDLQEDLTKFEYNVPDVFDDLKIGPVYRATLGRMVQWTTAINRYQEQFYRHAIFDATLRQGLKKRGLDVAEGLANPRMLDEIGLLDEATEKAMLSTFASQNPGGLKKFVAGMQTLRPISTVFTPFPRYMANAATYVAKHNPLGLLRLATTYGRSKADEVVAEAATGTLYLGAALALRLSDAGGEKWYEVKDPTDPNRRLDLRGFAGPFAPYLFVADAIKQYGEQGRLNYTNAEVLEATLSVNRAAGSTASILSWLQDKDALAGDGLQRIIGDWWGGFAVPLRNLKSLVDVLGAGEEDVYRDITENPLTGSARTSTPFGGQTLPPKIDLTTGKPVRAEGGPVRKALANFAGLRSRTVSDIEQELNRLNVPVFELATKTGIPKANRELARRVGKLAAGELGRIIQTDAYQRRSDVEREVIIRKAFERYRALAMADLKATQPRLAALIKLQKTPRLDKRRAAQRGVDINAIVRKHAEMIPETVDQP